MNKNITTLSIASLLQASHNAYTMGVQTKGRHTDSDQDHFNSLKVSYEKLLEQGLELSGKNIDPIAIAKVDGKLVVLGGNTRTNSVAEVIGGSEDCEKQLEAISHEVRDLGEMSIDEAKKYCFIDNKTRKLTRHQTIASVLDVYGKESDSVQASMASVSLASWKVYKSEFQSLPANLRDAVLDDRLDSKAVSRVITWSGKAKKAKLSAADRGKVIRQALTAIESGSKIDLPEIVDKRGARPEGNTESKGKETTSETSNQSTTTTTTTKEDSDNSNEFGQTLNADSFIDVIGLSMQFLVEGAAHFEVEGFDSVDSVESFVESLSEWKANYDSQKAEKTESAS